MKTQSILRAMVLLIFAPLVSLAAEPPTISESQILTDRTSLRITIRPGAGTPRIFVAENGRIELPEIGPLSFIGTSIPAFIETVERTYRDRGIAPNPVWEVEFDFTCPPPPSGSTGVYVTHHMSSALIGKPNPPTQLDAPRSAPRPRYFLPPSRYRPSERNA